MATGMRERGKMRIDRLVGILSILLQKEKVTAPELAEYFEVNRRTVNRDIEELCKAGIPIVTTQGQGGGISIMEGYKMDRTLLTNKEMQDILAGLRSLDSVNGTRRYAQLMDKLSVGSSDFMTGNQSVLIDLSSWYQNALSVKIETIRNAIDSKRELSFHYYSPKGESRRRIEPYYLIFKWAGWYVWGWCGEKQDFRLFKLNRMEEIEQGEHAFEGRECPLPDLRDVSIFPGGVEIQALFKPEYKWKLVEEYGPACYAEQADGRLLFRSRFVNREYLMDWLLAFRDGVELIEPQEIREEMRRLLERMRTVYDKDAPTAENNPQKSQESS